jgi:hypothetical protein
MAGILVTRGSRFSFLRGRPTLHVSYDMYPQWLRIAIEQSELCSAAAKAVDALWTDGSSREEIDALETELRAGMQACVAAAAAIDGFYGTVVDRAPVPYEMGKGTPSEVQADCGGSSTFLRDGAQDVRSSPRFPKDLIHIS